MVSIGSVPGSFQQETTSDYVTLVYYGASAAIALVLLLGAMMYVLAWLPAKMAKSEQVVDVQAFVIYRVQVFSDNKLGQ
ncbi:hypothetical protein MRX96_056179 [Rhipicephalus microplus]